MRPPAGLLKLAIAVLSHRSNRKCVGKHTDGRKSKRQDAGSGICTMENSVHGSTHRLSYRVVEDGNRWHWEVVGANRDVVASGSAQSPIKARAAAMAAGLEFLASHRGPKDDVSKGIHH